MAFFSTAPAAPTAIVSPPTVCSIPDLPAPSISSTCEEEWKRATALNSSGGICCHVVYGLAWHEQHLVAVTSTGQVCVWKVPTLDENEELDEIEQLELFQKYRLPLVKVQISSGVLYSVDVHITSQHQTLLIVSGDDGVLGFEWNALVSTTSGSTSPPEPLFHCKPHRSLSTVEINDFSISNNHIFGAVGDANGYKWDLETIKILATYPSAKRGYLHSIQCIPNSNTILMGGEDGILGIWDGHHDTLIDSIDLQSVMQKNASLVEKDTTVSSSNASALDPSKSSMWISNIDSLSENWWTVCGGIEHPSGVFSHASAGTAGGHVTSWHAPTRNLVAGCLTRETPQYSCSTTGTLVTVGNEGVVSHWTPSSLQRTGRVWCSPPSCFAAAVGNESNGQVLAAGGVGNQIDIFDNVVDNKSYSLAL